MVNNLYFSGLYSVKETINFVFNRSLKKHVFYASTNTINEISIMEAMQACGGADQHHWKSENHLILINKGVVVATLHSITQSKFAIISLFNSVK